MSIYEDVSNTKLTLPFSLMSHTFAFLLYVINFFSLVFTNFKYLFCFSHPLSTQFVFS